MQQQNAMYDPKARSISHPWGSL